MTRNAPISAAAAARRDAARDNDGKFGIQQRDEADIDSIDLFGDARPSLSDIDWDNPEHVQAVMDETYRSATRAGYSTGAVDRGYEVDDVAGDTLAFIWERQAKGAEIDHLYGMVNRATSALAARAGRRARAEDFAAYRLYQQRCQERAGELGRPLNSSEEAAIATDIRDNWHDPRHKPSTEFVLNVRGRERAVDDVADVATWANGSDSLYGPSNNDVKPGSYLDRALDHVEGDAPNKREARRNLFNALAETRGAPLIESPHLSSRAVTSARAAIPDGTDIVGLCEQYEDGNLDPKTADALFAPWSKADAEGKKALPSEAERNAVMEVLCMNRDYSYGLWDAAMRAATKQR